jgi:hypothetical protein
MEAVSYEMQEPHVLCCLFLKLLVEIVIVLQVIYGRLRVSLGNELTPTQVKDIPAVRWNADDGSYYLLVMTGLLFSTLCFNTLYCLRDALSYSTYNTELCISAVFEPTQLLNTISYTELQHRFLFPTMD